MKTATVPANNGEVIETTTRRTVRPAPDSENNGRPEFWAYLRDLDAHPGEWEKHVIYFYRMDPGGPAGSGVPLGKFARMLLLPDGTQVPMSDQEEVELAIMKHFGGRSYRFIVKRGSERIADTRIYIEAQPRPIVIAQDMPAAHAGANVTPISGTDGTFAIASKAIDTVAGQDRDAINIGINALANAAKIMQDFTTRAPTPASPADDVLKQALAVMLQKALNPPDPMEQFTKMLALLNSMRPAGDAGSPIVNKILDAGLNRVLNPPSDGSHVSTAAAMVQTLPTVASYVVDGIKAWSVGEEARRDQLAIMRAPGAPGAPTAAAAAPAQILPPPPQPARNPAPPANGASAVTPPSLEFIEKTIVDLLRSPISAEEAADRTLEYLFTTQGSNPAPDQQLVAQLVGLGETGLLQLFQRRPILRQIGGDEKQTPRLLDFIRAFLKLHADDKAQEEKDRANEHKPN